MTREEKVQELLARYVEAQVVDGVSLDLEELCKDTPELEDSLRERIRVFKQVDRMLAPPGDLLGEREVLDEMGQSLEARPTVPHAYTPGQILGERYHVRGLLGRGGMGAWCGSDPSPVRSRTFSLAIGS